MAKYNQKIITRDKKITIRVTRMEREILIKKSEFHLTSLSNYLRATALNHELPSPIHLTEEEHKTLMDLKNTLQNKLKKSANYFKQRNPQFALEISKAVEDIQFYLKEKKL